MTKKHLYIIFLIWIIFFITIIFSYINYLHIGSFIINFSLLVEIIKNQIFFIIFIMLFLVYFAFWQYKFYKSRLENRDNCQIQFVDITRIAEIWLDPEEILENNKQKELIKKYIDYETIDKTIVDRILKTNTRNTKLINNYLYKYIKYYSYEEVDIICTLIEVIEENKAPSVVSIYRKKEDDSTGELDNEAREYKSKKSFGNKSQYGILTTVSLEQHTLNVVDFMFEEAKKITKGNINHHAPAILMIALGHDIGKIVNSKRLDKLVNIDKKDKFYILESHEIISAMLMRTIFPDYKNINTISSAIETHHIKYEKLNKEDKVFDYGLMLKNADKEAREKEINLYYSEQNKKKLSKNQVKDVVEEASQLTKEQIDKIKALSSKSPQEKVQNLKNENTNSDNSDTLESNIYYDEMKFVSLLREYLFGIKELPSGRFKLYSVCSDDGKFYYFEKLLVKNLLKEMRVGSNSEIKITDKEINPLIKNLLQEDIFKSKSILITNVNFIFKPTLKHDTYEIKSSFLGFNENETLLKKRQSEHFKNAKVVLV